MRNIFNQYSQDENRLTHALMCTLDADRSLVQPFLKWCGVVDPPKGSSLRLTQQQVPGVPVSGDETEDGRGIPDGCFYTDDGYCTLVESKLNQPFSADQLRRHLASAARHGFTDAALLCISIHGPGQNHSNIGVHTTWQSVFGWFCDCSDRSDWAFRFARFLEEFESDLIRRGVLTKGSLTVFNGVRFNDDNPYNYPEAKRLLILLGDELQNRSELDAIGADRAAPRRGSITGEGADLVWDSLPHIGARRVDDFRKLPHFTFGLRRRYLFTAINFANKMENRILRKLQSYDESSFFDALRAVCDSTAAVRDRCRGAKTTIYALQRHYPTRSSPPIVDARSDVDLRTIIGTEGGVKAQPRWARSIYRLMKDKRGLSPNIQFGLETHLPYGCDQIASPEAASLVADSFIGMAPILRLIENELV